MGQEQLEGVIPQNPAIEKAAKDYVALCDHRMEMTTQEVEARGFLIDVMKEAGLTIYRTSEGLDVIYDVDVKEKIKVKGGKDDGEGD